MVRIKAPDGKKILDTRTGALHTEVVCDEKKEKFFMVADGGDLVVETIPSGSTGGSVTYDNSLTERIESLEEELSAAKILLGVE